MSSTSEYSKQYRLEHHDQIEENRRNRRRVLAAEKKANKTPKSEPTLVEKKAKKAVIDKAYRDRNADKISERRRSPKKRYKTAISDALRRGIDFNLSFEYWYQEVQKLCIYCRDKLGSRSETTVGLDRLDNNIGYEEGNVASCCGVCNKIKLNVFTFEETMVMVNALLNYRENNVK